MKISSRFWPESTAILTERPAYPFFVVPKHYVNPDSYLCEPKDVTTTGIEHKAGIKGSVTCSLSLTQKKRIQDADSARKGDFTSVPIIKHPDVRRMLLWMKSQVEAIMIAI